MPYFADYREQTITELEQATYINAQGADTPGNFVVPSNAKRITEIIISLAPEPTVDLIFGVTSCIHIHGSGVKLKLGYFLGPTFVMSSKTAGTTGANCAGGGFYLPYRIRCNIPVQAGEFRVDGFMTGEDPGAIHLGVGIIYDGVPGIIRDGDVRSIDLTTTNAVVHMTERADATVEGDVKSPYSKIAEIHFAVAAKITAGDDAISTALQLKGDGLKDRPGETYRWVGPGIGINADAATVSLNTKTVNPMKYITNIGIKKDQALRFEAIMLEGDVGTAFAAVGIGYA